MKECLNLFYLLVVPFTLLFVLLTIIFNPAYFAISFSLVSSLAFRYICCISVPGLRRSQRASSMGMNFQPIFGVLHYPINHSDDLMPRHVTSLPHSRLNFEPVIFFFVFDKAASTFHIYFSDYVDIFQEFYNVYPITCSLSCCQMFSQRP